MKKLPAFTLIETILYASLVTMIIGIFSAVLYNATTNLRRETNQNVVLSNKLFLQQKVENLLNSVPVASIVPASGSASTLQLTYPSTNQSSVSLVNGEIRVTRITSGVSETHALTNNKITASNLQFTRQSVNGQPTLTMSVTLQRTGTDVQSQLIQTYYLK